MKVFVPGPFHKDFNVLHYRNFYSLLLLSNQILTFCNHINIINCYMYTKHTHYLLTLYLIVFIWMLFIVLKIQNNT